MILVFLVLIAVPAFLPAPSESDGLSSISSFFQIHGLGPVVSSGVYLRDIPRKVLVRHSCPQGALTEYANKKTLNKPVPRLLTYGWVPVSSFYYYNNSRAGCGREGLSFGRA